MSALIKNSVVMLGDASVMFRNNVVVLRDIIVIVE
jgi:hypothetical protein